MTGSAACTHCTHLGTRHLHPGLRIPKPVPLHASQQQPAKTKHLASPGAVPLCRAHRLATTRIEQPTPRGVPDPTGKSDGGAFVTELLRATIHRAPPAHSLALAGVALDWAAAAAPETLLHGRELLPLLARALLHPCNVADSARTPAFACGRWLHARWARGLTHLLMAAAAEAAGDGMSGDRATWMDLWSAVCLLFGRTWLGRQRCQRRFSTKPAAAQHPHIPARQPFSVPCDSQHHGSCAAVRPARPSCPPGCIRMRPHRDGASRSIHRRRHARCLCAERCRCATGHRR